MTTATADHLYTSLGKVIVERRKRLGLSQEDLAKRSNVDRAFISEVERGMRHPSFGTVSKLAQGLNMRYSRLVKMCESYLESLKGAEVQREEAPNEAEVFMLSPSRLGNVAE